MDEFEQEVRVQLAELRGDVKTILGELGHMRGKLGTTDGRVAIISSIVSAVVVGVVLAMMAGCSARPLSYASGEDLVSVTVALVRPDTGEAYCSGVVTRSGIMTAAHCVVGLEEVALGRSHEVRLGEMRWPITHTVAVLSVDESGDVALLEAPAGWPAAEVRVSPLHRGEAVTVVGHPWGQPLIFSRGWVAAAERLGSDRIPLRRFIPMDVGIMPGNSGGPVFDAYGYVVGIVSIRIGEHLGGAVPVSAALDLLENLTCNESTPSASRPSPSC